MEKPVTDWQQTRREADSSVELQIQKQAAQLSTGQQRERARKISVLQWINGGKCDVKMSKDGITFDIIHWHYDWF